MRKGKLAISISLPREIIDYIDANAWNSSRNRSNMIEMIIRDYAESKGDLIPDYGGDDAD